MDTRYVAHGLQLRSGFELGGLEPTAARGLPELSLRRRGAGELATGWSGPADDTRGWTGRLGDGRLLAVERGRDGDTLFTYDGRDRFHLDIAGERLTCAPRRGSDSGWRGALLEKVIPKVAVLRGYEALHASAVASAEGVIAFLGASGAGKSTLADEFTHRGWTSFTDDALTLGRAGARVLAHPDRRHCPLPVSLLCVLARATGLALEVQPISANPLALAPHMLGFRGDGRRQRARFELYSDLLTRTPAVVVMADEADHPGDLAELIERELEVSRPQSVAA